MSFDWSNVNAAVASPSYRAWEQSGEWGSSAAAPVVSLMLGRCLGDLLSSFEAAQLCKAEQPQEGQQVLGDCQCGEMLLRMG